MKKIVVTGALGYIGMELCKIYSGESWHNEVVAIDTRFFSERVSQLTKWNIKFFQGDILDKNFLKDHISDCDVIHHLAGITNVAYVKSDKNPKRDKEIIDVAIKGTKNIINLSPAKVKIIFPSTHVVFDGLKKSKKLIPENYKKTPLLPYSSSKSKNEDDLIQSNKNFIILRLGSVYGHTIDSTRIKIVPNLFSKMAAENKTIKLFGGGIQLKSLVSIIDVARCFKFMEEKNQYQKQIYNLRNENITVEGIANICKKYNKKLKILKTKDEIPNPGYTLSNDKIKKTGFKFLYNLETSISEMIDLWKNKKIIDDLEHTQYGKNNYTDSRGYITNYELPEPINLIGLITSKKGTVRANHYHPIQEQKCLVTKGSFISVYKNLLSEDDKIVTHVVNENQLIVTKPNVAHAMVFPEDTKFLNLVRGEREHKNYGISHTMPMKIVDDNFKKLLLEGYKFNCRVCANQDMKRVLSLGLMPLANNLNPNTKTESTKYPLEVNLCNKCYNCQLSYVVDPKKMFKNYLYLSSTSSIFVDHFKKAADKYIKKFKLKSNSCIIDIGSNDGIALKPFLDKGFNNIIGVEPAKNIAILAKKKGIKTINSFFNNQILNKIKHKSDLIMASNVFAHTDQIDEITQTVKKILKDKGLFIVEIQYLLNTLKDYTFDNIYHEHVNYWCLHSLKSYFEKFDLQVIDAEKIDTHGGSLRVYISKKNKFKISKNVKKILDNELKSGIKDGKIFDNFREIVENKKRTVIKNFKKIKKKYKNIYGYGAPAKATTLINYFRISDYIDFVFEDNELKHNKYIPNTKIKIISKKNFSKNIKCLVVFAWNFFDNIRDKNKKLSKNIISIKDLEN